VQINVSLVTWPNHPARLEYFERTSAALLNYLTARGHALVYVCASEAERDPNQPWLGAELEQLCAARGIALHWHAAPASLGGNMNHALRICTAPVVFLVQDDIELHGPLDLAAGAEYLLAHRDVDLIRYAWPGDMTHFLPGTRDGWQIVDTTQGWHYGDEPQLRRPDFTARYGWYVEGGEHGMCEGDMLYRMRRDRATILAAPHCYFGNIGGVSAVPASRERRPRAVSR
jgi:hypothetical protein